MHATSLPLVNFVQHFHRQGSSFSTCHCNHPTRLGLKSPPSRLVLPYEFYMIGRTDSRL